MARPIRSRWVLPETVEPAQERCFLIRIPDDPQYIAAFKGTLYDLAKPYAWGNDDAHTALSVGARMMEAWNTIQEVDCEGAMLLRACEDDCGIEYSTDAGATWTCIDLSGCIADIVGIGIENAILGGILQRAGGQPGPSVPPVQGQCRTYHVILRANERWKIPSPLNTGDSITISNAVGGWTDGAFLWYCPDGKSYVLGTCGNNNSPQSGDPLQTVNHMALIGGYNTSTPHYFDTSASFNMPPGVTDQEGWLQANDAVLSDNSGQIEFNVEICSGAWWCYTWDFTQSNGGFYVFPSQTGLYVAGTGWTGQYQSSQSNPLVAIGKDFTQTQITYVAMTYDKSAGSGASHQSKIYLWNGSTLLGTSTPWSYVGTDVHVAWSVPNFNANKLELAVNNGTAGGTNRIRTATIYGRGNNPFGTSNCTP